MSSTTRRRREKLRRNRLPASNLRALGARVVQKTPVPPDSPPVAVVAAVIQRSGRVLLARRPAHKHLAFKWEFPGGKVDPGETPEIALARELREELACEVEIVSSLPPFLHTYDRATIEMIPFVCELAPRSPEPHPHEHLALAWVAPAELNSYDLAAADRPVVAAWQRETPA